MNDATTDWSLVENPQERQAGCLRELALDAIAGNIAAYMIVVIDPDGEAHFIADSGTVPASVMVKAAGTMYERVMNHVVGAICEGDDSGRPEGGE